jgi:hypothetical protein
MMARMGKTSLAKMLTLMLPVSLTALLTMSLSACSWRIDTPPPPLPSADETELARNAAAVAESRVVDSLADAVPTGPGEVWLLAFESGAAPAHLDALGGVYVPYPWVSPTASAPPPTTSAPPPTTFVSALEQARDTDLALALTVDDPDLALLLASIGLSHAAALAAQADADARAAGVTVDRSADRIPPPADGQTFGPLVPTATDVPAETIDALIVLHDDAQYAYEVVTARASGLMRGEASARGILHGQRAKALLTLVNDDPRGPSYVLPPLGAIGDLPTLREVVRQIEANIATAYLATFAELVSADTPDAIDTSPERAWLLAGAYDALVASVLWGDPIDEIVAPGAQPSGTSAPGTLAEFPGITVELGSAPTPSVSSS